MSSRAQRVGHHGKRLFQVGNELFDECLASGAVGGAVGEDVVAGAAIGVEHHANQVFGEAHATARREHPGPMMIAAEPGDDVDRRQLAIDLRRGQDHRRAMLDRPVVKRRKKRAFELGKLDPISLAERARWNELVDLELDRGRFLRVELGVNHGPIGVALARADTVRIGVEPHHGLKVILAGLERIDRAGITQGRGIDHDRLTLFPVLDVTREERLGPEPVGAEARLRSRIALARHHVHPGRDRLFLQKGREGHLESQLPDGRAFRGRGFWL